jgi:hypothetical protein
MSFAVAGSNIGSIIGQEADGSVVSVNGMAGVVVLTASDVGAVPYIGATSDVDLGGFGLYADRATLNNLAVTDIQLDAPGHYLSVGHIIGTADGDFNLTSSLWGSGDFVGFSANDGNAYFGANPYNYGYGVQYGASHILYITGDNSLYASGPPCLQVDGSEVINGNSSDYNVSLTVNDFNVSNDGASSSFQVNIPNISVTALDVKNNGDIYLHSAQTFLGQNNTGYFNSKCGYDADGGFAAGLTAPLYAQLEAISTTRSQLRVAYDIGNYVVFFQSTSGLAWQPAANYTTGYQFKNQAGSSIYTIDTANQLHYFASGGNTLLFHKGASNITPNASIAASGGKAVAMLVGSSGATITYDNTGTGGFYRDSRANIVAGTSGGGTAVLVCSAAGDVTISNTTASTSSTTGALIVNGGIGVGDAKNISVGTTTGTKIGTATSQKIAFWNATPVIQPASANQAAVTTTVATTAATNITPYGYTTAAQADNLITEVGELKTLTNQLRSDLVTMGLIKGAA